MVYQLGFLGVKQEKQILPNKPKRHLCDDCGVTHRTERKVEVDLGQAGVVKFEQKRKVCSEQQN